MKHEKEFDILLQAIGKRIKQNRQKAELTQEDMESGKFSIEYKYFQKIEQGKINITIRTLFKISKKLNVPLKDLLNVKLKK